MITPSDNTSATDGKTLIGWRFDAGVRGYVKTETHSQFHGQELPGLASNELQAATEPKNVNRTDLRMESVIGVTLTDKTLGTAWDTLSRFADEWTTTRTRETSSAVTAGSLLVGSSETVQDFPAHWARDTITVAAWQTRTRVEYDDTLGVAVTINETVIAPGDALPSSTSLKTYSKQEVDTWHAIQREEVVGDGTTAWTRTYYTCEPYTFPGVLTGFTTENAFEESNLRSLFVVTAEVRQAFSMDVTHKHIETIVTAAEAETLVASTPIGDGTTTALAALVQPVMKDLAYNGVLFSVSVGNVLCDTDTLTATTASEDTYYGALTDTFSYTETNISATAYVALVTGAAWHPIKDTLQPWRAGNFIRRRTFIKFL